MNLLVREEGQVGSGRAGWSGRVTLNTWGGGGGGGAGRSEHCCCATDGISVETGLVQH